MFALGLLAALQAPADQGVLVVRRDTVEVARETFHLREARLSSGAPGWILTATTDYSGSVTLSPILELDRAFQPLTLQYDVRRGAQGTRILARTAAGRMVLRYVSTRNERARELPLAGRAVILDDSLFSFYAVAGRLAAEGGSVTAVYPRAGRRESLTIRDEGEQRTVVNGDPAVARHVVVGGGTPSEAHVWLDRTGVLIKVELPGSRLSAERLP